jgi:hypothetical protein
MIEVSNPAGGKDASILLFMHIVRERSFLPTDPSSRRVLQFVCVCVCVRAGVRAYVLVCACVLVYVSR